MPTRFGVSGPSSPVTGGGNLTVMTRDHNAFDLLSSLTQQRLEKALMHLEKIDRRLRYSRVNHHVVRYAHRYFLTDPDKIASHDLAAIQVIVTKIRNGLSGDVTIKAGANVGRNDKDVSGAVRQRGLHPVWLTPA
jgi:hypothetical protein